MQRNMFFIGSQCSNERYETETTGNSRSDCDWQEQLGAQGKAICCLFDVTYSQASPCMNSSTRDGAY